MERALRFIESRDGETVLVKDLCEHAGISARTLHTMFVEAFGVSPNRYLRIRKLHLIRAALAMADCRRSTVSGVCARFGLSDGGRMASDYRALFNEYPRATLARNPGRKCET
jgi:AraC family ethanolamine operon transcriptional activator